MRFGLLGPLAVWTHAGDPVRVPGLKVRILLADLLVHEGRPVSADRLTHDLWGDRPPRDRMGALHVKVSQLRRALEEAEPGGRELVAYRPPGYQLQIDLDSVDTHQFLALTAQAREAGDLRATATLLSDALGLWRGPALSDFADEEFARLTVVRLEEQRLNAIEEQAEARLQLGEHHALVSQLGELVARYPLRERLRAAQLRALYRAGRQSEALASYRALRDRLAEELGLDPSPELAGLHQAILEQDPGLLAAPSPPILAASPATNLPAAVIDLIGRTDAIAAAGSALEEGRLVTLTGPGGVGKTRLAVETASRLVNAFPDGAWLAELASVDRPASAGTAASLTALAEVVMAALGIRDHAPARLQRAEDLPDLAIRLADVLRHKQLLLVLDNCEHVIEAAAELAGLLLQSASGLRILATSLEPLGISGERLQAVPPLEVPGTTASAEPSELERFSSVQLFVTRASAAAPGFALDAGNARAVASICRRLDGIPLALELAATRVRVLGVRELASRLDDRFRSLSAGKRDAPARQQTLRAVIDWSWDLLTDPERAVLRRLATQSEGCVLDAAEDVCAGSDVGTGDVVDLLARLVDRSLVVAGDRAGGPRYRLLESVAAYCLERLREAGELDQVQQRHHDYYLRLAERAEPHLRGHDQRHWLARLDAETANLRSAFDGMLHRRQAGTAIRLVNAMAWYWFLRGRFSEARRSLDAALALDGDVPAAARAKARCWRDGIVLLTGQAARPAEHSDTALPPYDDIDDPVSRARAAWFLGFARSDFGDLSASEDLVNRALAGSRARNDPWGVAAALSTQAKHASARGDLAALRRNSETSYRLFSELGDGWGQLQATEWLGEHAEVTGDYERAIQLHRDGLRRAGELQLWPQAADRRSWLGRVSMLIGNHAQARELLEQGMQQAAEQGYKPGEIFAAIGLGYLARREGRLDAAETCLRGVLEWCRQMSFETGVANALVLAELGFTAEQRGDEAAARALHLDGLAVARKLGDPRAVALSLAGLAGAEALAGQHGHAAQLLGAAAAARESSGTPVPATAQGDVDRVTAAARAALGDQVFTAEFERGKELGIAIVESARTSA